MSFWDDGAAAAALDTLKLGVEQLVKVVEDRGLEPLDPAGTVGFWQESSRHAARRTARQNAIFHADRGTQYTSRQIAQACADLPVLRSMGKPGLCWDNAAAE